MADLGALSGLTDLSTLVALLKDGRLIWLNVAGLGSASCLTRSIPELTNRKRLLGMTNAWALLQYRIDRPVWRAASRHHGRRRHSRLGAQFSCRDFIFRPALSNWFGSVVVVSRQVRDL